MAGALTRRSITAVLAITERATALGSGTGTAATSCTTKARTIAPPTTEALRS